MRRVPRMAWGAGIARKARQVFRRPMRPSRGRGVLVRAPVRGETGEFRMTIATIRTRLFIAFVAMCVSASAAFAGTGPTYTGGRDLMYTDTAQRGEPTAAASV
ncbi:MAG TPA: hypothetical protein VFL14_15370, partial [Xanthomonadales bacterium]|nr:hypothetical protein [Xanthomonadales bacterium]